jgi:hypothetical protein
VERFIADSNQRGGRREVVAQTRSMDVEAVLKAQGAGRYRVTCIDRCGLFLAGGVFTAEVSPDTLTVQEVRPKTPSEYPRRASPAAAAQREERRAQRRVVGLEEKLRVSNRECATLRRDGVCREERHLTEKLRLQEAFVEVAADVYQLQTELRATKAALASVQGAVGETVDALREALAEERRLREEGELRMREMVAQLAASQPSTTAAPVEHMDESWSAVEPEEIAQEYAMVEVPVMDVPVMDVPVMDVPDSGAVANRERRTSGLETLANTRNVGSEGPRAPTRTEATRTGPGAQLIRFFEDSHWPRKK